MRTATGPDALSNSRAIELRSQLSLASPTLWVALAALAAAALTAPLGTLSPTLALAGITAVLIIVTVWVHPPAAAYLLLFITPLIAGMDRGMVVPLLRPNEVLALLLGGALIARALFGLAAGRKLSIRFNRIDASILLLAVLGSILPLLWMVARDRAITQDDVLYAFPLWKYYGVFLLVRASVRTERQVRACLWLSMSSAALVAVIAILQAVQLFGVPELLFHWYAPGGETIRLDRNRGTSTLAQPFAVADLMVFNLAIAFGLLARGSNRKRLLFAGSVLFVLGTVAAGEVSGLIGLIVALGAVGVVTGQLKRVLVLLSTLPVAGLALWPVVERRINAFGSSQGFLPESWRGRLDNLSTFFWPDIFSNYNVLTGVRTATRVASPEWRKALGYPGDHVYVESGHTWLLWTGGIPFLLAFFYFLWTTIKAVGRIARERMDAIGVAAIASFASLWLLAVLMTLDPHLTLRGSADVLFALLALACTAMGANTKAAREPSENASA